MATVTVDQKALVLNAFATQFQNNLIARDLVDWHKYEGEMDDRNGLKVVEQVGPRYVVTQTTDGVKDLSGGVQDSVFGSEQFVVNKTFGASMGWGDFVKIRDIGAARESTALRNAAMQLAEVIDKYILEVAALASNNWTGTSPGAAVDSFGEFMAGYTRLKEEGVEDGDIRAALTYGDKQALGEAVIDFKATDQLATGAFRGGFEGAIGGIPTMFTQQLANITNGNDVTGVAVDGADQNVNYSAVAVSTAPGRYMTQTLHVDGVTTGTGTVTAGSVFTITGVNAWDNRAQQSLGRLQQFVVVSAPAFASGVSDIDLVIFPAIIVQGTSDVNTAHATVDSVPADDAPITFIGTASQVLKPRLMIQKQAINVCTADLIMPATGEARRQALTKIPGSVRMWQDSTFSTGEHRIRFDIALTANVRDRRRIVRLSGNT
jgi:hypothetical protein